MTLSFNILCRTVIYALKSILWLPDSIERRKVMGCFFPWVNANLKQFFHWIVEGGGKRIANGGSDGKAICLQWGRPGFDPWVGKIPWRRKWQPTPALLPRKFHERRSLVGYSPLACKESVTTEVLHFFNGDSIWLRLCNPSICSIHPSTHLINIYGARLCVRCWESCRAWRSLGPCPPWSQVALCPLCRGVAKSCHLVGGRTIIGLCVILFKSTRNYPQSARNSDSVKIGHMVTVKTGFL